MNKITKPCPFCGAEVKVFKSQYLVATALNFPFYAGCSAGLCCPIAPRTAWCKSSDQAIETWNTANKKFSITFNALRKSEKHYREGFEIILEVLRQNEYKSASEAVNKQLIKETYHEH